LPDVRMLNEDEKKWLRGLVAAGSRVVVNGADATDLGASEKVIRFADDPGRAYNAVLEKDFEAASPESQSQFLSSLQGGTEVRIQASPKVATSISRSSDGHTQCFFANFAGLRGGVNPVQTPQTGVQVAIRTTSEGKGFFLPFLGQVQPVSGVRHGDSVSFTLPTIPKGAVFWYEP
jgi:hypothetical protein